MKKAPGGAAAGAQAAGAAVRRRATTALRRLIDVRRRGTPDDVHDLRVALRRLQEVIDLIGGSHPGRVRRRLRRRAQRVRRSLAEVRDADVQQALAESLAARLGPGAVGPLTALRARLAARAAAARDARRRAGTGLAVRGMRGRVAAFLAATPAIPRARLAAVARRALAERARAAVRARRRALDDGATAMHAFRIAVKKYRYTLEVMDEVGLGRFGADLAEARRLQRALGRLHDLDLLVALARRAPGAAVPGLLAILREERRPLLAAARDEVAAFTPRRPGARRAARSARSRRPLPAILRPGRSPLP